MCSFENWLLIIFFFFKDCSLVKCKEMMMTHRLIGILQQQASPKNRTRISEFPSKKTFSEMSCSSDETQPVEVANGFVCVRGEKEFKIINVPALPAPYSTSQMGGVTLTSGSPQTMNWSSSQVWKCVTMAFNGKKRKKRLHIQASRCVRCVI